ncbi:unnamed protein product [Brachionus calyciflorus]|uniref:RRM domain-containing protein n=1 Tax=Brachionus calyciflorus TaxID=104777 RepID=A0A814AFP3_9BILA|nr:unnamed protein product [Brachionus calyciflorus]
MNNFSYNNSMLANNFYQNTTLSNYNMNQYNYQPSLSNTSLNQHFLDTYTDNTSLYSIPNYTSFSSNSTSKNNYLNKVFVRNLSYEINEDELKEYFSKFGNLVECVIIKNSDTKLSRGFGFVKYSDSSMIDELMKKRPHFLKNRKLDIRRQIPRLNKTETNTSKNKIFISGFGIEITELDLKEYFSKYGSILKIDIRPPKQGMSKCYGFITFDDYDSVDKILIQNNHKIKNYDLNIKRAKQVKSLRENTGFMTKQFRFKPLENSLGNMSQQNNLYGSYNSQNDNENINHLINNMIAHNYARKDQTGPLRLQKFNNFYKPY